MDRIVTLIPSATEIVCALGFEQKLVARSHECDYPPGVTRLPACTAPKFDPDGTSYQIDQRVKAIVQEALSVYRVDAGVLSRVRPDLIVTQSQCEVCAVSLRDVEQAVAEYLDSRPRIVSLAPASLADVLADFERVAEALGVPERGGQLAERVRRRNAAVAERCRDLAARPTVACIEWIEPLMAAGNWMPELVEMAGGVNLFGEAGRHSPWIELGELAAKDPDVIFIAPCGFAIERTLADLPALARAPQWAGLRAVHERRVYLADGNQYFNRPGPRLAESLEILAETLHPGAFAFGHQGRGWRRL